MTADWAKRPACRSDRGLRDSIVPDPTSSQLLVSESWSPIRRGTSELLAVRIAMAGFNALATSRVRRPSGYTDAANISGTPQSAIAQIAMMHQSARLEPTMTVRPSLREAPASAEKSSFPTRYAASDTTLQPSPTRPDRGAGFARPASETGAVTASSDAF
jgi:hypothetical protein